MEQLRENEFNNTVNDKAEVSIFDDLKPLPVYYSERVIYVFSVLFGVLFGSVLMAINLKNTLGKKGVWQVVVFGILFTVMQGSILNMAPKTSGLSFLFNIGGAQILKVFFWEKYIGKDVPYSKKPFWLALAIGIILAALIIFAMISNGVNNP